MEDKYLEVLQEIKSLMDSRLGDKLKGGVSVEKVSVSPMDHEGSDAMQVEGSPLEESQESPMQEQQEQDLGIGDDDKSKLAALYSSMK